MFNWIEGSRGPVVIMTDDSRAERKALSIVFPEAVLLLCTFHILQANTRHLRSSDLSGEQQGYCYQLIYDLMYSKNIIDFNKWFVNIYMYNIDISMVEKVKRSKTHREFEKTDSYCNCRMN